MHTLTYIDGSWYLGGIGLPSSEIKGAQKFWDTLSSSGDLSAIIAHEDLKDLEPICFSDECAIDYDIQKVFSYRRENRYSDYNDPNTRRDDAKSTRALVNQGLVPKNRLEFKACHVIDPKDYPGLRALHDILAHTLKAQNVASFYGVQDVFLKAVPSNGSRHPYEAFLKISKPPADGMQPGLYYYDPLQVKLLFMTGDVLCTRSLREAELILACDFDRVQARYRSSVTLKDVYLEQGHIISNCKARCETLGRTFTQLEDECNIREYLLVHHKLELMGTYMAQKGDVDE